MQVVDDTAYKKWCEICASQGWENEAQIIHLEGFIRMNGCMPAFAKYAQEAADEENADPSALTI